MVFYNQYGLFITYFQGSPQFVHMVDKVSDCWRKLISGCKSGTFKKRIDAVNHFRVCYVDNYERAENTKGDTTHFFDHELWKQTIFEIVSEKADKVLNNITQVV